MGPRTPVVLTVNMLFLEGIQFERALRSPIIILDYVLNIWIELIKWRNDHAMQKFYLMHFFKSSKFGRNFEKSRNFEDFNFFVEGGGPALRVIRAGTWLAVHRSLPYRCSSS